MKNIFLIVEPVGINCNLNCTYCYYNKLNKIQTSRNLMSSHILERLIVKFLDYNKGYAPFIWHGGEPTLAPISFYEKVIKLQNKHKTSSHRIRNMMQSNGTLLNEKWVDFIKENNFAIGLSIDGPKEIHEIHRPNSFERIMNSIKLLKEKRVEFGVICVVNSCNVNYPFEIYNFFKNLNISSINIKPCISLNEGKLTDFSVKPMDYANFMISIFNLWFKDDNPNFKIKQFSNILLTKFGGKSSSCSDKYCDCMKYLTINEKGDVYSCNDFAQNYEELSYGNIQESGFTEMLISENAKLWEKQMFNIASKCKNCEILKACGSGCTKVRLYLNDYYNELYCQSKKRLINFIYNKVDSSNF
jgi:uncharacterized protein